MWKISCGLWTEIINISCCLTFFSVINIVKELVFWVCLRRLHLWKGLFSFYRLCQPVCNISYIFCMLSMINIRMLIQWRWLSITYSHSLKAFLRTLVWILSYCFPHCLHHRMLVWIDSIHYRFFVLFSVFFSFFFHLSLCSFFFGFLFRWLILHFDKFLIFTVGYSCEEFVIAILLSD